MKIADLTWMQVEEYLKRDDRAVLPIGSTEQHAYLSLATDNILAERVALEAAEPLEIAVFPVLAYGITPYFQSFPGTVSLTPETHGQVLREILDSLAHSGFRRFTIVNGHGGNAPSEAVCAEWRRLRNDCRLRFHNWWKAPRTLAAVRALDPVGAHASWMESFPWTRTAGVEAPEHAKPAVDWASISRLPPEQVREAIGDGNFGGLYRRPDQEMSAVWRVAVEETREAIAHAD